MQVGVDSGMPQGDLIKQFDGKYIYKFSDGTLDIDHYNREFSQYSDKRKEEMKKILAEKLDTLNKPKPVELIYDLGIGQIAINTKDAIFDMLDDTINLRFTNDMLTKNNRLFYLGIVLIIIACLSFFYLMFGLDNNDKHIKYESNIKIDN
jgi:hypothetical protein